MKICQPLYFSGPGSKIRGVCAISRHFHSLLVPFHLYVSANCPFPSFTWNEMRQNGQFKFYYLVWWPCSSWCGCQRGPTGLLVTVGVCPVPDGCTQAVPVTPHNMMDVSGRWRDFPKTLQWTQHPEISLISESLPQSCKPWSLPACFKIAEL